MLTKSFKIRTFRQVFILADFDNFDSFDRKNQQKISKNFLSKFMEFFMEKYINQIIHADCMDILKQLPDKCIDLVLTDPPYGIDYGKQISHTNIKYGWKQYDSPEWDKKRPSKELFNQLLRVSKNQIIWGGNYFSDYLPSSQCWLVWNKGQRDFSLADGELAYTSFDKALRIFDYARAKQLNAEHREHPTQKPLKLFEWCLQKFSNEDDLILDCFSGSGTTAVACHNLKRRFICIEKDYDYWKASVERLKNAQAQQRLNLEF